MYVTGGPSDDVIEMYGGPGNNTMTYDLTAGNDLVTILGGGGYNTLTINKNEQNFTLQDYQGRVLFQTGTGGSTITVANLQRITVIGDAGKPIYTYNPGIVPCFDCAAAAAISFGEGAIFLEQPRLKEVSEMGAWLLKRTIFTIILIVALLPVSQAMGGLCRGHCPRRRRPSPRPRPTRSSTMSRLMIPEARPGTRSR